MYVLLETAKKNMPASVSYEEKVLFLFNITPAILSDYICYLAGE